MNEQEINRVHAERMQGLLVLGSALGQEVDPLVGQWAQDWVRDSDEKKLNALHARIKSAFLLLREIERFGGFVAGELELQGAQYPTVQVKPPEQMHGPAGKPGGAEKKPG